MQTPPAHDNDARPLDTRTWLGHPRGLFLLFLVEMWERFSYYGMRGLLVLYLITVMAASELKPGLYTNTLEFVEFQQVDGKIVERAQTRQLVVAVDTPWTAPASTTRAASEGGSLQLAFFKGAEKKDGKVDWASGDDTGALLVSGPRGGPFQNSLAAFQVSNPTDKPIKCRIGIRRDTPQSQTYFTVNDSAGVISTEIKPDKSLKPNEQPFRAVIQTNSHQSGRNWTKAQANVLYGWYTGLAYLFPILGGMIADRLIGTHRSMLVGAVLIAIGHVILGISGMGELAFNSTGLSLFIMGLAVIVLGTGHFKPTVSVMVGQLYGPGDPRRDGAFTIFYMGINLGAFICAFVCGTLGEKVGWHYGFGSAAVGMILGLVLYLFGKPIYLKGIGDAPRPGANRISVAFFVGALILAGVFALAYHLGAATALGSLMDALQSRPMLAWSVVLAMVIAVFAWMIWFLGINDPDDRGPVITIFVYIIFNAFFWVAFEQAGSSLNVFTEQNTNRFIGNFEVPATWFQSVNAGLIFIMAPLFAVIWTALGKRKLNPAQPNKIGLGLVFLGIGYIFMVLAGRITVGNAAKASMIFIIMTYFWHTVGELCVSPTGLSYVTKAAPKRFMSLLMGIWFVSSFAANLGGGLVAAQVEAIEAGKVKLPWNLGGQADFFFLFVIVSIAAGIVIFAFAPLLKKLQHGRE